jgi:hypothetical protein
METTSSKYIAFFPPIHLLSEVQKNPNREFEKEVGRVLSYRKWQQFVSQSFQIHHRQQPNKRSIVNGTTT